MLRRMILAGVMTGMVVTSAAADTMGPGSPYTGGYSYSPTSNPFESFLWTPLDFAAFGAYGGDFANIRKPVTPVTFFGGGDQDFTPPGPPAPDDEQAMLFARTTAPLASPPLLLEEESSIPVPEPGIMALAGAAMLGLSTRLRRRFMNR